MTPLPIDQLFLMLAALLLAAGIFGAACGRLGIPPVIGELAAGLVLGPSLLGWVAPAPTLQALAEIGVVLLLFEVGMDADLTRLGRAGARSVAVALAGFFLPLALGFGCAYWLFGLSHTTSLLIGATLTATSIGITARVLDDVGRRQSDEGQVIIGAAVLDDILGVITLAVLQQYVDAGTVSAAGMGRIVLFVGLFMLLAPLAAKITASLIAAVDRRADSPGLLLILAVSLVLLFSTLAHALGAPVLLGGFAAGLALGPSFRVTLPARLRLPFRRGVAALLAPDADFSRRVETQMRPLIHLFAPVFFVLVGASVDLGSFDWRDPYLAGLTAVLLAAALAGKWAAGFVLRSPSAVRHAVGLAMVPRGEVGLIFIQLGLARGLADAAIGGVLLAVVALTTFLGPVLLKAFYRFHPAFKEAA
ncbi:High-affinity Na(+)/H(+) antiporter NhaS3 [Azoarcus sp. Aa7]|nr:High-affinity Na(+)/H(+) antiporter NhaS3 [Azoarcus sp. Aa7]